MRPRVSSRDVRESVLERFRTLTTLASRNPYRFSTWHDLVEWAPMLKYDTWCLVMGKWNEVLGPRHEPSRAEGFRLVEAFRYPHGLASVIVVRDESTRTNLTPPLGVGERGEVGSVLICSWFTNDEPYSSFAQEFVNHYAALIGSLSVPARLGAVLYGFEDRDVHRLYGLVAPDLKMLKVRRSPGNRWTEWEAGNNLRGLASSSGCSHVLRLDGDVRMSARAIESLLRDWASEDHWGIYNLKEDARTGPGLLFADVSTLASVEYLGGWPVRFYHVDTEYLWQQARVGRVPRVVFTNTGRLDHDRPHASIQRENFPRLVAIGRRGR